MLIPIIAILIVLAAIAITLCPGGEWHEAWRKPFQKHCSKCGKTFYGTNLPNCPACEPRYNHVCKRCEIEFTNTVKDCDYCPACKFAMSK